MATPSPEHKETENPTLPALCLGALRPRLWAMPWEGRVPLTGYFNPSEKKRTTLTLPGGKRGRVASLMLRGERRGAAGARALSDLYQCAY